MVEMTFSSLLILIFELDVVIYLFIYFSELSFVAMRSI